jgi:RNA polymerase sigma-70 factor (ECF subfamily)
MMGENKKALLEAREANEHRLVSLYEEYYGKVARYIFVRIGDRSEAEDLASEVFLKALDSLKTYQERGLPMQAWLFRIAHNLVVDHLRKVSRQKTVPIGDIDIPDKSDPVAVAETNLEMERVTRAMQSLTEDQREVIRLRFMAGLTSKEVSQVLNKSDGAVREMQRASLEKLRNLLNESGTPG